MEKSYGRRVKDIYSPKYLRRCHDESGELLPTVGKSQLFERCEVQNRNGDKSA